MLFLKANGFCYTSYQSEQYSWSSLCWTCCYIDVVFYRGLYYSPWLLIILTRLCGVTNAQAFWFFRSSQDSNYLKWMVILPALKHTYLLTLNSQLNVSQRSGAYGMKVNSQVSSCFSRQLRRLLDILHMAIVAYSCYLDLVTNFTVLAAVEKINWTFCVGLLFSVLMLILILLNCTDLGLYIYNGN